MEKQVKFCQERVAHIEKNYGAFCETLGSITRKMARMRDKGDLLAKQVVEYADKEKVSVSTTKNLKDFAHNLAAIQDYRDAEIHRLDNKVVKPLSAYGPKCKKMKQIIKTEQSAINREIKQRKNLEKVRDKKPGDAHSISAVSCYCTSDPDFTQYTCTSCNVDYQTLKTDIYSIIMQCVSNQLCMLVVIFYFLFQVTSTPFMSYGDFPALLVEEDLGYFSKQYLIHQQAFEMYYSLLFCVKTFFYVIETLLGFLYTLTLIEQGVLTSCDIIFQAETELQKAAADAAIGSKGLQNQMSVFEKDKLADLKKILADFVSVEMVFHAKAIEYYSQCFENLAMIDEEEDLQEFSRKLNLSQAPGGETLGSTLPLPVGMTVPQGTITSLGSTVRSSTMETTGTSDYTSTGESYTYTYGESTGSSGEKRVRIQNQSMYADVDDEYDDEDDDDDDDDDDDNPQLYSRPVKQR
ncbi:CBY1-interacting BAR domain-containing protein 1-like [Ruditapes philippinarum]|uniref:CBY1-interacting BAR domain-containing protein 1-like n=1 Tax=Ruditapes philippinarum TaxID=129788 RepID=UPI00295AEC1E|nr:CBY1-interacting BAR domain-containing protein 1-like [Ruditapes philippinarum]